MAIILAGLSTVVVKAAETLPLTLHAGNTQHQVVVEIANTPQARATGLMQRSALAPGHGMLFLYGGELQPANAGYWMYRTLIPLDIAFIGPNGEIKRVFTMPPCRHSNPRECPIYRPGLPYSAVLEMAGGYFRQHGIDKGTRIDFPPE